MPLGFARVVHDGASTTIVAACADIFLMVADSPRLDSDELMTFGFRAVGIGVPGSFAPGTARSQYPLCEFFRQLTFQVDCPNAYLPEWLTHFVTRSYCCGLTISVSLLRYVFRLLFRLSIPFAPLNFRTAKKVPEGRNNVAHRGSGGKVYLRTRRNPLGVTQGPQQYENM